MRFQILLGFFFDGGRLLPLVYLWLYTIYIISNTILHGICIYWYDFRFSSAFYQKFSRQFWRLLTVTKNYAKILFLLDTLYYQSQDYEFKYRCSVRNSLFDARFWVWACVFILWGAFLSLYGNMSLFCLLLEGKEDSAFDHELWYFVTAVYSNLY